MTSWTISRHSLLLVTKAVTGCDKYNVSDVTFPFLRFFNFQVLKITLFSSFHTILYIFVAFKVYADSASTVLGFDSRQGLGIFLSTTASRTALEPTQPPIQLVPSGSFPPAREADHSPPPRLHGVVLS
jgi:hypothetical protein